MAGFWNSQKRPMWPPTAQRVVLSWLRYFALRLAFRAHRYAGQPTHLLLDAAVSSTAFKAGTYMLMY